MADLNEDDILKLVQRKTAFLLLRAFSSLSNIATATPAVKKKKKKKKKKERKKERKGRSIK